MPEIHNPDLESRGFNSGGDVRRVLSVVTMVFMFAAGYCFVREYRQCAPVSNPPGQTQHAAIAASRLAQAGGSSIEQGGKFGWLTFIAWPLYQALRFLHDHGIYNWGWSIVVLTVTINLLVLWPRVMSMRASLKMMRVQPGVNALQKRYGQLKFNDPRRAEMTAEMMALYKAEGANMYGACLPMLLQLPLLFAYFSVLRNAPELHHAGWLWLSDLSLPDPLHILPVLIIGTMALTPFVTPAAGMSASQGRVIGVLMAAAMGFSLWHYAAGLSLYWVTGNIINLLVQLALNRTRMGREMRALAAGRAN